MTSKPSHPLTDYAMVDLGLDAPQPERKAQRRRTDLSAPLPLGQLKAIEKAVELRETNPHMFTWGTIAEVIRIYHGFDRGAAWWRLECAGRVESRARGNSFTKDAA